MILREEGVGLPIIRLFYYENPRLSSLEVHYAKVLKISLKLVYLVQVIIKCFLALGKVLQKNIKKVSTDR
jgi:hypothetical protein